MRARLRFSSVLLRPLPSLYGCVSSQTNAGAANLAIINQMKVHFVALALFAPLIQPPHVTSNSLQGESAKYIKNIKAIRAQMARVSAGEAGEGQVTLWW